MFNVMKKYIKAFTLAEVLITLGIIGVVAAMTIPALMNATQDREFINAWKEDYSLINQATMQIKADNGGTLVGAFPSTATQMTLFADKLKNVGICNSGSCQINPKTSVYATIQLANGSIIGTAATATILDNGSCAYNGWGLANFGQNICAEFYVDVNGNKPPNIAGRDVFWLGIGADKIFPAGSDGIINATYKCPGGSYCNSFIYLNQ